MMTGSRGLPPPTQDLWDRLVDAIENHKASFSGMLEELRSREATIEEAQRELDKQRADFAKRQMDAESERQAALAEADHQMRYTAAALKKREDEVTAREKTHEVRRQALEAAARALLK